MSWKDCKLNRKEEMCMKIKKYAFKSWLKAASIRALKTMAQSAIGMIGASTMIQDVNWIMIVSSVVLAGVLSVLTSIAGLPEVPELTEE